MSASTIPTVIAPPMTIPPSKPFRAAPPMPPSDDVATMRPEPRRHSCGREYEPQTAAYCWFCHCG